MKALRIDEEAFSKLYPLIEQKQWLGKKYSELLELYNSCDSLLQQTIVLHLLKEFKHVNSAEIDELGKKIAEQIEDNWKFNPADTIITAISDEIDVDGSQAFLQNLKNKFSNENWTSSNFLNKIGKAVHQVKDGNNLVLFDDYIGSGETIIRKYDWCRTKLNNLKKINVNLRVISYAIMSQANEKFLEHDIKCYSPLILKKGISDYFESDEAENYKREITMLENKFEPNCNNMHIAAYSLGYAQSEAIFTFESYNIPDNVFPIFWWPEIKPRTKRRLLFKRL